MAMTLFRLVASTSTALVLTGCGTTYSLQTFSPTEKGPKSAFIDIKQRAVLTAARPGTAAGGAGDIVTCAEPSPDALSSLASEFAADAKYKDSLQATLGFSQQEAASFIGLRTQTIQLLRDGMYRLCEGYMSGALTQADYAWLSRRYQKNMVALLTIEQLTRVAQAPTVAQASQGLASASRSATAIQSDLEEIDKIKARLADEKKKIEDERTAADALPDTDTTKTAKIKEIKQRLDDKQAAITRADEVRVALLEGLRSAKGILVSGTTTIQVITDSKDTRAATSDTVAHAIAEITTKILDQDDLPTLCFQLLTGGRVAQPKSGETDPTTVLMLNCAKIVEARATLDATAANAAAEGMRRRIEERQDKKTSSATPVELRISPPPVPQPTIFLSQPVSTELAKKFEGTIFKSNKVSGAKSGGTKTPPPASAAASAPTKK